MVLEPTKPPPRAYTISDPTVEALKRGKAAGDVEVAARVGKTGLLNLRSHQ